MDCFDTRFAELRPNWEGFLAKGLVYPCGFIVLDSSPAAWNYDKEKCGLNVEEEDDFIKDLAKTQDWEHSASVAMDDRYVALWNARKSCEFTCSQVKTLVLGLVYELRHATQ